MIEIARVLKAQGINGEIKVQLFSDNTEGFVSRGFAYFKNSQRVDYEVTRTEGSVVYLRIEGINTRNDAEALRGVFLYIQRSDFDEPQEGEHYVCDLIGLSVFDEEGGKLGVLKEILQHGAADVYVVKGGRSFMFPALKNVISSVNGDRITVDKAELDKVAVYED